MIGCSAVERLRRSTDTTMVHRWISAVTLLACACAVRPNAPATEDDVIALEPAAAAGEREAIRALFDVHAQGDGAVAEGADMVLGTCARRVPQVFLEELVRFREELVRNGHRWDLMGHVLCNAGIELVDDFAAQAAELEARRAALMTVTTPSLREARDACVSVLREQIEMCRALARQDAAAGARDQARDRR